MPEVHTVQRCRWAQPTLFAAHPFWTEAEDHTWTCRRDGVPRIIEDPSVCATCPRWESRRLEVRRNSGVSEGW